MKKLMIAAASAAMISGAFAGICDGTEEEVENGATRAYDFKASVKLVDGKTSTSTTKVKGTICEEGYSTTAKAYYRVKASRTFKGVFIDCDTCQIEAVKEGDVDPVKEGHAGDNLVLGTAAFYVSSSDSKYKAVYNAKDFDDTNTDYGYRFQIANFIGGPTFAKSTVAEGLVQFNFVEYDKYSENRYYSLLAAGFGSRSGDLIKTLSGNLAGAVSAATWCGIWTECYEPCTEVAYYDTITVYSVNPLLFEIDPEAGNVWQEPVETSPAFDAVYGTWSIKYNSTKTKLATTEKVLTKTFGSNYWMLTKGADETVVFPFGFIEVGQQQ